MITQQQAQYTKLADALESYTGDGHGYQVDDAVLSEAARIIRAAASVDVAGLMELAEAMANAAYASAVDYINGAGADATKEVEARAALESALRMALAAREWQPIETAPKDERILLLVPAFGPWNTSWWPGSWSWAREQWAIHTPFSTQGDRAIFGTDIPKPIGWMPLPAAAPKGTP